MNDSDSRTITVAAVQPALRLGEVEHNLRRIEDLIRSAAREHDPDIVLVPESMTTPNVYSRDMRQVARPVDGQPYVLLTRLARELDCLVGGGFIAVRGSDTYGTYVLAQPDGAVYLHDKDIPTAWENNYYRGGDDEGVFERTSLGRLGCACGWEWARAGTARRVRDAGVRMLVGGMCWPSFPHYPRPLDGYWRREREIQRQLARELPRQVARLIGAPVAMPSHVGDITFDSPLMPGVPWRTQMIGETQIVERDGTVLARLTYEDGEGHVGAQVTLAEPEPLDPIPDRFWVPIMPNSVHAVWHPFNWHGRIKYHALKWLRRHPWQAYPSGDLPDHVPASEPAEAEAAVSR